jgi:hypothetical protein
MKEDNLHVVVMMAGGHDDDDDDDDTILYFDVLHQQPNGQLQIEHRRNIVK